MKNFDSRMQQFENGFEGLLQLAGVPASIDEFVLLYKILLITVKEGLFTSQTLTEVQQWKAQGMRLKELLFKEIRYVRALRDEAFLNEFQTLDPDTGMERCGNA